jgi:glyoxylase-like metal-dependent hydrolase (beta-lactamase superfamily II)
MANRDFAPGIWSWHILRAGSFRLDGGSMFGVVPKVLWSKLVTPDEHNRIPLQTNCVLLRRAGDHLTGETILIETGFGQKWSDKERSIYELERRTVVDAMVEIGVSPADIQHVIVTHLHFDHAAGLTSYESPGGDRIVPTFPNARIHVQKSEWDDALANKSTMTRTYLRTHLDPIADQLRFITGEDEVIPGSGIFAWPMPGHTWGQQAIRFQDGDGTLCFAGDVLPTVHHVGLAFSLAYDMEPYTSMLSKRALLTRAAAENWRLILDHEPGHPVVRVTRDPERPDRFALHRA